MVLWDQNIDDDVKDITRGFVLIIYPILPTALNLLFHWSSKV